MSVQLAIDDGDPWYLSPDIWVVPGTDPNGAPGIPADGQTSYVWARVHNRGTDPVNNATVLYWWADPSTIITPNTAHPIGTSNVSLGAGQVAEVLCLTAWTPSWVNGGHECLIAQVFSLEDPLPPHTPDTPFDPPDDPHTAQKNLTLLVAPIHGMAIFPFLVGNAREFRAHEVTVEVTRTSLELVEKLAPKLGLRQFPTELKEVGEFGVQSYRCGEQLDGVGRPSAAFSLAPGARQGMALAVKLPDHREHGGALFLIEQRVRNRVIGGIGVLVLTQPETKEARDPEGSADNA